LEGDPYEAFDVEDIQMTIKDYFAVLELSMRNGETSQLCV
jgi:hypothetical protein